MTEEETGLNHRDAIVDIVPDPATWTLEERRAGARAFLGQRLCTNCGVNPRATKPSSPDGFDGWCKDCIHLRVNGAHKAKKAFDRGKLLRDEFVYVISDGRGRLKFGWARDPIGRMRDLQVGTADTLILVAVATASPAVHAERWLQWKLRNQLVRGEWFNDCSQAQRLIDKFFERLDDA